jgi:hypothetical protein
VDQRLIFGQTARDFMPQGHVAHFVRDTVSEEPDLSAVMDIHREVRGAPPFHPAIMSALQL